MNNSVKWKKNINYLKSIVNHKTNIEIAKEFNSISNTVSVVLSTYGIKRKKKTKSEKFFENISIDRKRGCINWMGYTYGGRYGGITIDQKSVRVHRLSWELFYGKIPKGLLVCHHCDNTLCVNPTHLFLGTQKDNMQDMYKKNRQAPNCGSLNGRAKVTENNVIEIRKNFKKGLSLKELSIKHKLSECQIGKIVNRKNWTHI